MEKENKNTGDQAQTKEKFAFLILNEIQNYFKGRQGEAGSDLLSTFLS